MEGTSNIFRGFPSIPFSKFVAPQLCSIIFVAVVVVCILGGQPFVLHMLWSEIINSLSDIEQLCALNNILFCWGCLVKLSWQDYSGWRCSWPMNDTRLLHCLSPFSFAHQSKLWDKSNEILVYSFFGN